MAPGVETFVNVSDYTSRYGAGAAADSQVLAESLSRAARIVRDELAAEGVDLVAGLQSGVIRVDSFKDVVCDMVRYAVRQEAEGFDFGATQSTMTGGPYSQSSTFSTPVGSLSFTRVHRRRLGIRRGRFATVHTIGRTS